MADENGGPAPAAAPAPASSVAPAAASAAAPAATWYDPHIPDPETRAFVAKKGWTDVNNVVKSYQGVEKLIGRDPDTLLTLPKEGDVDGERAMWTKLGLPADDKGYPIKDWAGDLPTEDEYNGAIAKMFHGASITTKQAEKFVKAHNEYIKGRMDAKAKEYEQAVATDKQALLSEWKGGHERMLNVAQGAAKSLGFTEAAFDGIEKAIGYSATMKLFVDIGKKLGEDKFIDAGTRETNFTGMLTPEQAKQAWESMKVDPGVSAALRDKFHPGHKAAVEKQTRLFSVMYPGGQA